jgi:hypothetical protein
MPSRWRWSSQRTWRSSGADRRYASTTSRVPNSCRRRNDPVAPPWRSPRPAPAVPAAHRARYGRRHAHPADQMPLAASRPRRAGRALRQSPAFSAIGRDLVEHRVGEITLRARADGTSDRNDVVVEWARPALSFSRRAHAGHDGGRLDPHPAELDTGSTRASPCPPWPISRRWPRHAHVVHCANPPPSP